MGFYFVQLNRKSWDSVVGIATAYGLERPRGRSLSPGKVKNFHFSIFVQTGSGVHPASYLMGNGGSFPEIKAAEA
jgi:hypothetical protein